VSCPQPSITHGGAFVGAGSLCPPSSMLLLGYISVGDGRLWYFWIMIECPNNLQNTKYSELVHVKWKSTGGWAPTTRKDGTDQVLICCTIIV